MTTDRLLSPPRASTRPTLFDPIELGRITLRNRIVMAPMTRSRAGAGDAPGPMNATYYAQRASAGLIVTEGAQISPRAGLSVHAGHLQRRADRGLETGDRRGAP